MLGVGLADLAWRCAGGRSPCDASDTWRPKRPDAVGQPMTCAQNLRFLAVLPRKLNL